MPHDLPDRMAAVQLTGHGGPERLIYREDVPVPRPGPGEVVIRIGAAGVNNTDINTRLGWYSKSVTGATGEEAAASAAAEDGSWTGVPLAFPRIQGADACGRIVAVGEGVEPARLGERVLVRPMQADPASSSPVACLTFGSEIDGGFAQYARVRAPEAYRVNSPLSDAELASFPCAASTAQNMLHRAAVKPGERVLVTGASGGVGSAAVQLARARGARVIAVAAAAKAEALLALGAVRTVARGTSLVAALGRSSVDVVLDVAAGPAWPELPEVLAPGGRYAVAGAIAGPVVPLDVRTLYLKDLTFLGCTWQPPEVFAALVQAIENGALQPLVARTYPLESIREAQAEFQAKTHVGKLVLLPPA